MAETYGKSLIPLPTMAANLVLVSVILVGVILFYSARWLGTSLFSLIAIWIAFNASKRSLLFIGVVLAFLGSWMSWWCQGDFISYCSRGIDFYHEYETFTLNNIGFAVVGMSLFTALIAYQFIQFNHAQRIVLFNCLLLTGLIIFEAASFSIESIRQQSITGRIYLDIGFVMVALGILLQLLSVSRIQEQKRLIWGTIGLIAIMPIWVYAFHGF